MPHVEETIPRSGGVAGRIAQDIKKDNE